MKKTLSVMLLVLYLLALAGCTPPAVSGPVATGSVSASEPETWGITMRTENERADGLTLVIEQSGGNASGELETGSYYALEQIADGIWMPVEFLQPDLELAWTLEAHLIPRGGSRQYDVNWKWLYGELAEGQYRISKSITDFRGPGDFTEKMYYAEFAIVD